MPTKSTRAKAKQDARQGKSPTTQAGEFVKSEMHALHEGGNAHVKSARQAIAVGLSEARRAGVKVPQRRATRSGQRGR